MRGVFGFVFGGGCGSGGGHGGGFFGGGGAKPLFVLTPSSGGVAGGIASLEASLQTFGAWGVSFIDLAGGGFGVDRVISSVLVERLASFSTSLLVMG